MITEGKPDEEPATNEPPAELIELLGKVSDLQLQYQFNWPYQRVVKLRKSPGIPPFKGRNKGYIPPGGDGDTDLDSLEWWSTAEAAADWGVKYSEAIQLVATIPGLVRRKGTRIKVRKGTPKPRRVNGEVGPSKTKLPILLRWPGSWNWVRNPNAGGEDSEIDLGAYAGHGTMILDAEFPSKG